MGYVDIGQYVLDMQRHYLCNGWDPPPTLQNKDQTYQDKNLFGVGQ